jgi:Arc/MetJ-type ribon-helix-helix transcriptional regulator
MVMSPALKKVTIELPEELLEKAQQATGSGITQTIRSGLQLLAASQAYDRLRELRGKVRFSRTWEELKDDR